MKIPRLKLSVLISRGALLLLVQLLCFQFAKAQSSITGVVKDQTGVSMPGVVVQVKGKAIGTSTDANGAYTIKADKTDILQFRFVGYLTKEVLVGDQTQVNVTLQTDMNNLNEVIVTGYSKQSKRDITGAISTVSADVIKQTPVNSLEGALEGRVAGLAVDGQGGPGNTASVRIRGVGTLGDNDPLYVIDGVQMVIGPESEDISNLLNPNDIESLTVLKDPSLEAQYGANGANGVIIITTKHGKMGAPQVEYNGYVGYENPRNLPHIITPQQQADALYASYKNSGVAIPADVSSLYGNGTTPILPYYIIEDNNGTNNVGVPANGAKANPSLYNQQTYRILKANQTGTDWWGALFQQQLSQNHNISISGAGEKNTYAVTLGYLDDHGTLLNTYDKRYSFRVNTDFKIRPWLRFGENMEASFTDQSSVGRGTGNEVANLFLLSPLLPKYDIAGNISGTNKAPLLGSSNPMLSRVNSLDGKGYAQSIIGSIYGEADLFKGLTYTNQIGFQLLPTEFHGYQPPSFAEPIPSSGNEFTEGGDYSTDWRWLNKLSYTTTINKIHEISAFVGYEAEEFAERSYGGSVLNIQYPTINTEYLSSSNEYPATPVYGYGVKYAAIGAFANVTYSLMDKYLFTATGRRDGSSKFIGSGAYQDNGAVSAGWRISKENFLQGVSWINDLKLRASYGTEGNNSTAGGGYYNTTLTGGQFGNYALDGSNTTSMNGFFVYQIGNPTLTWEDNKSTNIGIDASLFHNSFTATINWYDRRTDGLILAPPSPGTAGSALAPLENIMSFSNKGLEVEATYTSHINDVKFDMSGNITTIKNNVDYIDGLVGDYLIGGTFGSNNAINLTRSEVGKPVSQFYGYVYQGLYRTPSDVANHPTEAYFGITPQNALGHVMYADLNHDGKIDPADQTYLGSPLPKFTYGYDLNIYYKQFDIGLFFQGSYGNKIYDYAKIQQEFPNANGSGIGGITTGALDTWSPSNPNATLPIFSENSSAVDISQSSFFVESGSYLRLKIAQLGYTFTKIKGIKRLRVYAQAFNLLTITKYDGIDPEVSDGSPSNLGIDYGSQYPISQKFLFGASMSL